MTTEEFVRAFYLEKQNFLRACWEIIFCNYLNFERHIDILAIKTKDCADSGVCS